MTVIQCQSCGFENDPTRVFCHNCGVRLERPAEVVEQVAKEKEAAAQKAATLRQAGPGAAKKERFSLAYLLVDSGVALVKLGFLAALLAVIFLMLQTPDNIPAPLPESLPRSQQFKETILEYAVNPYPRTLEVPAQMAEFLLANEFTLSSAAGSLALLKAEPRRLYSIPGNNEFVVGIEFYLLYLDAYLTSTFAVENGEVRLIGGSVGRLPVPKVLLPYWNWTGMLTDSGSELVEALRKCREIEITPSQVTLRWTGQ